MDKAIVFSGELRHPRWVARSCGAVLWVGALAGCGGGSSDGDALPDPVSAAGVVQAGELPESIALGEVRTFQQGLNNRLNSTNRLSLAWAGDGAFTGSVIAQTESGLTFIPGPAFTLQHNGPAVSQGLAHEVRYANGFVVLTALHENVNHFLPFVLDFYPPGVVRVPPTDDGQCEPTFPVLCYNGLGLFSSFTWPARAGDSLNLLVRREDPANLAYSVLVKANDREDFHTVAVVPGELSATIERGAAWKLDFPTTRVKVRGCDAGGQCVDSNEQPLQSVLTKGVIPLQPLGDAANAHVAISANGNSIAAKSLRCAVCPPGPPGVQLYARVEEGAWDAFQDARIESDVPGFGRTFALSGDGNTLAVEASTCAVATTVCDNGAVIVYRKNRLPQEVILWSQQARIEGVRSPRLSHNGDRLVAIGIPSMRGNAMVALVRNGSTWSEQLFPPLDYVPLDLELSADGFTLAVSRQGTSANPCGCRAVVVYACRGAQGWQQAAMLHSNKRLDTPGSDNGDGFGFGRPGSRSLAVSGDGSLVAVGASLDSSDASDSVGDPANHRAPHSGAVYLFKRADDGTWQKQAFLKARAATTNDYFGHAVAVSRDGDVVFGGARGLAANAPEVNHNHALDQALPVAGANAPLTGAAAYVFQQTDGGGWIQRAAAAAPNASRAAFDSFFAMAISADTGTVVLATGEPAADNPQGMTRTVFVY